MPEGVVTAMLVVRFTAGMADRGEGRLDRTAAGQQQIVDLLDTLVARGAEPA